MNSKVSVCNLLAKRFSCRVSSPLLRPRSIAVSASRNSHIFQQNVLMARYHSSDFKENKTAQIKIDKPQLMLAFTCKKCDTRSSHTMSKQAYTKGTVLITCPGCKNRHLIADNLKIFSDSNITVEDILKAKGESVSLTPDDLCFEDIPKNLQSKIGHLAKDAPSEFKKKLPSDEVLKLAKPSSD